MPFGIEDRPSQFQVGHVRTRLIMLLCQNIVQILSRVKVASIVFFSFFLELQHFFSFILEQLKGFDSSARNLLFLY
jgi:hypothetical protein